MCATCEVEYAFLYDLPIPFELVDPPIVWVALEDIKQTAIERTYIK